MERILTKTKSNYFELRGFDKDIQKEWRLVNFPDKEYANIRYYNAGGEYLYYRRNYYGKKYRGIKPKYSSPKSGIMPEGHSWLYGLWMLKYTEGTDRLVIVEGEYNCISCWILGYYALGVAGQVMVLRGCHLEHIPKHVKKIIILYDEAEFARRRAKEILEFFNYEIDVYIAEYRKERNKIDANDYLVKGLKDEFDSIIKNAEKYEDSSTIAKEGLDKIEALKTDTPNIPSDDFVKYYCEKYACEVTDAPKKYHELVALGVIATILNRNVYLPYGIGNLYPNLWIVLIGKSTIMRKTATLNIGRGLIHRLDKDLLLPYDFSPEGLFETLKENSKGVIFWSEFGSFLTKATKNYMSGAKEFLTEAFDCPGFLKKKLSGKSPYEIEDLYINIMTATSLEWFVGRIGEGDVKGGFLGRFVYIPATSDDKDKWYPIPKVPEGKVLDTLISKLEHISNLSGEMSLTEEAKVNQIKWLRRHEDEIEKLPDDKGISGFYGRLSDYLLKFAMLYEISSTGNMEISIDSINRAMILVNKLKKSISEVLERHVSFTEEEKDKKKIFNIIEKYSPIERARLLQNSHMSSRTLDVILTTLIEEEKVKISFKGEPGTKKKKVYRVV